MQLEADTGTMLRIKCDTCEKLIALVALDDELPRLAIESIANTVYAAHLMTVDMNASQEHQNGNSN